MAATRASWRRLRSERGAEIIELALVTPLLLLLFGGIIDFAFVFQRWQLVTNAAREGARVGILPAYSCTPGVGGDVEPRVQAYLSSAGVSGASVEVVQGAIAGYQSCGVRVLMSQPLQTLGVFGRFFGGDFTSIQVASSAVMRTEIQGP
jgi:TadE-like protein